MRSIQSEVNSTGKIINLLTTDASRVEFAIHHCCHLFVGPIYALVLCLFLLNVASYKMFCGLMLLLISIPFQSLIGKLLGNIRFVILFYSLYKLI